MSKVSITVASDGEEFAAEIVTVKSTYFGINASPVLSSSIQLEGDGTGVSFGGMAFDSYYESIGERFPENGFGVYYLQRTLEAAGVGSWEELPGSKLLALYRGTGGWGAQVAGIATLTGEHILISDRVVAEYRELLALASGGAA